MKPTLLALGALVACLIGTIFVQPAGNPRTIGQVRLGLAAAFAATLIVLLYQAYAGKSPDESLACLVGFWTPHCKAERAKAKYGVDFTSESTAGAPRRSAQPRGQQPVSDENLVEATLEQCRRAESPRAPSNPVRDVMGIFPGMSLEDAKEVLRCRHPRHTITSVTRFRALPDGDAARVEEIEFRYTQPGPTERSPSGLYTIWADGLGQRQVLMVTRTHWFGDGEARTSASLFEAIARKYGALHDDNRDGDTAPSGAYVYDVRGRPLVNPAPDPTWPTGGLSPDVARAIRENRDARALRSDCAHSVMRREVPYNESCGVVIGFRITGMSDGLPAGLEVSAADLELALERLRTNARSLSSDTAPEAPL